MPYPDIIIQLFRTDHSPARGGAVVKLEQRVSYVKAAIAAATPAPLSNR
jgi:hypothetical protein